MAYSILKTKKETHIVIAVKDFLNHSDLFLKCATMCTIMGILVLIGTIIVVVVILLILGIIMPEETGRTERGEEENEE